MAKFIASAAASRQIVSMSISTAYLEELRSRISLAEYAGGRISWDKRKSNPAKGDYWACCPFHSEKTPSFHIDDRKGYFYCFGCHEKGDAISFVRKMENCSFEEAVATLAARAGMAAPKSDRKQAESAKKLRSIRECLQAAHRFYCAQLSTEAGLTARNYLAERGIDEASIRFFAIGYAPTSDGVLRNYLRAEGYGIELMDEAGLVSGDKDSNLRDRFRDRIVFPIHDSRGSLVGFGGRALREDAKIKYLNSPETRLFSKRRLLYNFHHARAQAELKLVIAEGYMDVIALHRAGIEGAVAPLGTALTEAQLALAWRVADEPIVIFDGDEAGARASVRARELALPKLAPGKSLRFADIPAGFDPDDFIRHKGAAAMKDLLGNSTSLIDALWNYELAQVSSNTPEQIAALEDRLQKSAGLISDNGVRQLYILEIRSRMRKLRNQLYKWRREKGSELRLERKMPKGALAKRRDREALIIAALINHPSLIEKYSAELVALPLKNTELARLREALLDMHANIDHSPEVFKSLIEKKAGKQIVDALYSDPAVRIVGFVSCNASPEEADKGIGEIVQRIEAEHAYIEEMELAKDALSSSLSQESRSDPLSSRIRQAANLHFRARNAPKENTNDEKSVASARLQHFIDQKIWIKERKKDYSA